MSEQLVEMGARGYTCVDSFTYARGKDIKKSAEKTCVKIILSP